MTTTNTKFSLGQVVATPGASEALTQSGQTPQELLDRHLRCDWGVVCPEDAALNDEALVDGSRLLSAYLLNTGVKIWIITEAKGEDEQRASTCLLLPDEY